MASDCGALLVLGISGEVTPVNTILQTAKMAGATVIEINVEPTALTNYLTDIFLQGKASEVMTRLVQEVETIVAQGLGNFSNLSFATSGLEARLGNPEHLRV